MIYEQKTHLDFEKEKINKKEYKQPYFMKQNYNLLTSSTALKSAWNTFFQKSFNRNPLLLYFSFKNIKSPPTFVFVF